MQSGSRLIQRLGRQALQKGSIPATRPLSTLKINHTQKAFSTPYLATPQFLRKAKLHTTSTLFGEEEVTATTTTTNLELVQGQPVVMEEGQGLGGGQDPEVKEICDKILKLNVVQVAQLAELFRNAVGITDADLGGFGGGGGGGGGAGGGAAEEEVVVEQTAFELKLTGYDDKAKIKVIKEVRAITGLGLKESKELVEGAPKSLKKDLKKEEAEELMAKIVAVGGKCEIV